MNRISIESEINPPVKKKNLKNVVIWKAVIAFIILSAFIKECRELSTKNTKFINEKAFNKEYS